MHSLVLFSRKLWCVSEVIRRDSSCRWPTSLLLRNSVIVRLVISCTFNFHRCVCVCVCVCVGSRCCSMAGTRGYKDVNTVRRSRCYLLPGRPDNTSGTCTRIYQSLQCIHTCLLHVHTTYYRCCALKRVFPGWKAFVVLKRHKKLQITLADQHFRSIALPKYVCLHSAVTSASHVVLCVCRCFAALKNYSALGIYKRELQGQAQGFRRYVHACSSNAIS